MCEIEIPMRRATSLSVNPRAIRLVRIMRPTIAGFCSRPVPKQQEQGLFIAINSKIGWCTYR